MFEYHDIQQNTDEWAAMRCGRLGSSSLAKVMANYGKAFGDPAKKLAVEIAVQQLTGTSDSISYSNEHMERGHEQEPLARFEYEQEMFCDVLNGGYFCTDFLGCSPDGLVGKNGVIEIKSVIPSVHYDNIRRDGVDPAYKWQCIANVEFTDREWLDFVSFCAAFPEGKKLFVHRVYRDRVKDEIAMIHSRASAFRELVEESKKTISETNYINIG